MRHLDQINCENGGSLACSRTGEASGIRDASGGQMRDSKLNGWLI